MCRELASLNLPLAIVLSYIELVKFRIINFGIFSVHRKVFHGPFLSPFLSPKVALQPRTVCVRLDDNMLMRYYRDYKTILRRAFTKIRAFMDLLFVSSDISCHYGLPAALSGLNYNRIRQLRLTTYTQPFKYVITLRISPVSRLHNVNYNPVLNVVRVYFNYNLIPC